jgi:hypothetical protein
MPEMLKRTARFLAGMACIVFIFGTPPSALAQTQLADSARAWITIETRQSGLPVFIDDQEIGRTPLRNFPVTPGEHVFAVRRNFSMSWLESDWSQRMEVSAGDSLALAPRFQFGYSINSTPAGAQVWVEGKRVGTTPYVLRLYDDARASVALILQNYQAANFEIRPESEVGQELSKRTLQISLTPVPTSLTSHTHDAELQAANARHRKLSLIAGGVSLVAGAAAVLLKQEADDAYAAYLVTGTPAARESYYARAQKYDRYFSVAFGVSQVSFVFSVYSFLKSVR